MADFNAIFLTLGLGSGSGSTARSGSGNISIVAPSGSGYSLDYSGIPSAVNISSHYDIASIPSVCTELANDVFFVCDPGITGSAGVVSAVPDYNWAFSSNNSGLMNWIAGLNTK